MVGSDGPSICGDNRRCTIEGHWELKSALPVPEPGTMGVLLAAIAMLGLRHWHRPSWGGRSGRFVAGDLFPALHGATAAPRLQRNRLVVSIS
ncbi:MAG: PEP-CTERM sorting domain-containing protein [Alphaproteobacteria bacterium]